MTQEEKKYINFEYEVFDGETFITFNIVSLNVDNQTITCAVSNRGRISLITYDLLEDEEGNLYFEYGCMDEHIFVDNFEEVEDEIDTY